MHDRSRIPRGGAGGVGEGAGMVGARGGGACGVVTTEGNPAIQKREKPSLIGGMKGKLV